jgi:hypothetical protein
LVVDVAGLRSLTDDELIRRHDAAYRSDRVGSYTR